MPIKKPLQEKPLEPNHPILSDHDRTQSFGRRKFLAEGTIMLVVESYLITGLFSDTIAPEHFILSEKEQRFFLVDAANRRTSSFVDLVFKLLDLKLYFQKAANPAVLLLSQTVLEAYKKHHRLKEGLSFGNF